MLCPVYQVPPHTHTPFYLKGKWWEGRKAKKCPLCLGTLTSPYETKGQLTPYHPAVCSQVQTLLFRFLAMLFQDCSLQVKLNSEETTKPKPFATSQEAAAQCPKNYILFIPIIGLLVKPWALVWNA